MKTLALLALGFLAVVSAKKKYFYEAPNLMFAEHSGNGGVYLRTLNEFREHLGLSEEFTFQAESSRKSSSGVLRVRLRQMFKGLPIRVATLQASQNENGFYTGAVSGLCPTISSDFDTSASNKKKELKQALVDYINTEDNERPGENIAVEELQNFNSEKEIHIDTETGKPVVVYFVSALVERGLNDGAYIRYPRVLFKAGNLEVISAILPVKRGRRDECKKSQKACPRARGGNQKVCGLAYGPQCDVCLNASVRKNRCVLENDQINVKTVKNTWKREEAELVSFPCDQQLNDRSNGAFSPAADAFYYAQVFYDVLHNWGRLERTNREPHTLYVHFGDNYPNSFWDGRSTTFGDGTGRTFPYTIREVIGHEMAHAVTDSFGNLVFDKESESVHEAFSDICGKAISFYLDGDSAGWEFARGLLKNTDDALRYFDDPTRDGSTIASYKKFTDDTDGYVGMGIYLKAFYTIVTQQGVRFRDAFEAFVFANQIYWTEETTFIDGACGIVRAASDLGLDAEAFVEGFKAADIKVKKGKCSLKGTEDHIVYCDRSAEGEVRRAEISSYRTARYVVRQANGKSNVRVTISGSGDQTVTIKSNGNTSTSHERSAVIAINGGVDITLSADSDDIVDVKVLFEFE